MSRIKYNDEVEYEIFENGYDIYQTGMEHAWVTQRTPYDKLFKPDGTYEENAILHCEDLTKVPEKPITDVDKLRADIDFLSIMTGIDLPSEEV